jgi:polysaccharide pyruvyl transferase WcaK-like protein
MRLAVARLLFRRVVVLGVEVGPVVGRLSRLCMRYLVNHSVSLLTVRNIESRQALRQMRVVRPRTLLTCDLAQLVDGCGPSEVENIMKMFDVPLDRPLVGFVVRTLGEYPMMANFAERYFEPTWPNDGRTRNEFVKIKLAWLADQVVERLQATPVFLCYRYEEPRQNAQSREYIGDNEVIDDILRYMRHDEGARKVNQRLPTLKMIGLTRRMDMLVTMRLHAMILSSNAGTPAAALHLEDKIPAYLRALGQGNRLIGTNPFNHEEAWGVIADTFENRQSIREVILQRAAALRSLHKGAWEQVTAFMEKND